MAFLNFMKKREELPPDIDLDMPPEPPKMMEEDISAEGPIDEELMPLKKAKPKEKKVKAEKEELPELPPLPKIEEELPPLPEDDLELPPPPSPLEAKKKRKGFFSFLKPKKAAEKLPLPEIGEEMPPLPEMGKEFPEIPPLPKEELPPLPEIEGEFPPLPEAEEKVPVSQKLEAPLPEIGEEPLKPEEKPIAKKEVKEEKLVREKRFVTINDFKKVQEDISGVKGVLRGIDGFFVKLEEVKGVGDKEYAGLNSSLKDIQNKIMFIDKTLFKEV